MEIRPIVVVRHGTMHAGFNRALLLAVAAVAAASGSSLNESSSGDALENGRALLARIDEEYAEWSNRVALAEWNYASNLTEENLAEKINVSSQFALYSKEMVRIIDAYPWQDIEDFGVKREFSKLADLGKTALPDEVLCNASGKLFQLYKEYERIVSQMENIYSTAKICDYEVADKCDLALDPEIVQLTSQSQDPELLEYLWAEWRRVSGEKIKPLYPRYVELSNAAAKLNRVADNSEYWLKEYESDDFPRQIETLWQQVRPLYLQLHAYVRRELRNKYGEDIVSKDGPIPAHLLGNVWAQTWSNVANFTLPFPGKQLPNVTDAMLQQGYNVTGIFRLAEHFFVSLNLSEMPDAFWERSILERQQDREMICHASAWDFYDGKDFRIKQCARIDVESLETAHHEMGHIQYYLQYKDQPTVFKRGANPGFHEAVGDVISLSVLTPSHLRRIGLLDDDSEDSEATLNHLYEKGLEKIAFLPFAYATDRWRWAVFKGETTPARYNCNWWSLVEELQGIEPPIDRSEDDFDPGSKYHVIADVEYIRYYVSFIVQFQFHKALCERADQYDSQNPSAKPLHRCDIYESKEAGNLLSSMLRMGSSRPWQDAMEKITGQREMDTSGLLEYFQPLTDWLTTENKRTNEYIGWRPSTKRCVQSKAELRKNVTSSKVR